MAFVFDQLEPVPNAVRRLVVEQLDLAASQLTGAGDDPGAAETAVHEARKALKRSRAVVRLVRPVLGGDVAKAANAAFRDAGQALSAARDADVLLKTWRKVTGDGVPGVDQATVDAGRRALEVHRDRLRAEGGTDLGAVVADLREAKRQVLGWPDVDDSFDAIAPGLQAIHGQARDAMATAVTAAPDDEAWHDWRKRVKDTWYHLTLLVPAWEPVLAAEEDEVHRLSELLGDDHDLAVLAAEIASRTEPWSADEAAALVAAVENRRRPLQRQATDRGWRVYAETPKAFVRRLGGYWSAWRTERDALAHATG